MVLADIYEYTGLNLHYFISKGKDNYRQKLIALPEVFYRVLWDDETKIISQRIEFNKVLLLQD